MNIKKFSIQPRLLALREQSALLHEPPLKLYKARGSLQRLARGSEQDLVHVLWLEAVGAPGTQHNDCALRGEKPSGCFAQPAACARNDDDLVLDSLCHIYFLL